MPPNPSLLRCLWIALSLAFATLPAHAQFGGGPGWGRAGGPPGGGGMDGGPRGRHVASASSAQPTPTLEQQLDNVRVQLGIRLEQESLWLNYQEKIGALVGDQLRSRQNADGEGSAIQQMERKIDLVRNRLTALENIADAARKLYLKLDDFQKGKADRLLAATLPALHSGFGPDPRGGPGRVLETSENSRPDSESSMPRKNR